MSLFISNTTLASLGNRDQCLEVLQSTAVTAGHCQALVDFVLFDKEHTGEEVGKWLDDAHAIIGCKPAFIGSPTVDGAANAGKSVEILKLQTKDDRAAQIVTSKCDAHQVNTTGTRALGTSAHKFNLNQDLGTALTLLHTNLVRVCRSVKRLEVVKNVQKEHNRTKTIVLGSAVKTLWNSEHEETRGANINQQDLHIALDRMISSNVVDKDLYEENRNNLAKVKPTKENWFIYHQY